MSAIILNFVNNTSDDNFYFLLFHQLIYGSFGKHTCVFSNGWMFVVTDQVPTSHCSTNTNRYFATFDKLQKMKKNKFLTIINIFQ
jgi:hypothetical protein